MGSFIEELTNVENVIIMVYQPGINTGAVISTSGYFYGESNGCNDT